MMPQRGATPVEVGKVIEELLIAPPRRRE